VDELVDSVVTTLVHIGVPRNPSLVSILLLIFERQKEFVAVNRAALIEMFVQILLEKIGVAAIRAETLDFRNQEHYLEYIAGRMVDQDQFTFDRLELERETLAYFEAKGLRTSIARCIDYFIEKEIFVETRFGVSFKFRIIAEYFIAKRMIEDSAFMSRVLAHERLAMFLSEFDIVTGLQRNNNSDICEFMARRVEAAFDAAQLNVGPDYLDTLRIQVGSGGEPDPEHEKVQEPTTVPAVATENVPDDKASLIEDLQNRASQKEVTLDQVYDHMPSLGQSIGSRRSVDLPKGLEAILYFSMYARAVRNCELIDDVVCKTRHVTQVVEYCARLVATAVKSVALEQDAGPFDLKVEVDEAEEGNSGERRKLQLEYMRVIAIPLMYKALLGELLGSVKLESVFRRIDTSTMPLGTELLHKLLWLDLLLPDCIERVAEFSKRAWEHDYLLDLLFNSLCLLYVMRRLSKAQRSQLDKLIGDLWIRLNGTGTRILDVRRKESFVEHLRKQARLAEVRGELSK
jgi:hypothetical protein